MKKLKYFSLMIVALGLIMFSHFISPTYAMLPSAGNSIKNSQIVLEEDPPVTPPVETPELVMPDDKQLGPVIVNDETGIPDSNFYQLLVGLFNEKYKEASNYVRQAQLRVNMLSDFTEINFANMRIISIAGLNKLNLSNLEVLNLGANSITSVNTDDIKWLSELKELYLYENGLTEITIPTALKKLQVLNLNANKLSEIDLSRVYSGKVSLSFNKFKSINDIKLPQKISYTDLTVELFNNNITDADEIYAKNGVEENGGKITVELGIQGIGLNYKITDEAADKVDAVVSRDNAIKFYNVNDNYNLEVKISRFADGVEQLVVSNNPEKTITEILLPIGEYKLEYLDKTTHASLYDFYNPLGCGYKSLDDFKVIPKTPTVKFIIDGKEYDYHGKFTSWNAKLVATNNEEEGELYYSISGGDWQKGSEVKLNKGGTYNVAFKVVVNEISSNSQIKQVYMSINPYISDVIMIILVGAVIAVVFFVLIPLIVKKFIKK